MREGERDVQRERERESVCVCERERESLRTEDRETGRTRWMKGGREKEEGEVKK